MTAFLAFHFAAWTESTRAKVFYYIAVVIMVLAVYFAYSRTGYIALAIPVLVMPFVVRSSRLRYVALSGMAVCVLVMAVPMMLQNKQFFHRMTKDTVSIRVKINESFR